MKTPLLPGRLDRTLPFTPANRNIIGEMAVTQLLMQPGLKRAFGGVYARVDPETLRLARNSILPIIFCLTHSGWWDGHIAFLLHSKVFRRQGYLMMEDHQLARYFFFTWAGVFGINRHDPRKAIAAIEYISEKLKTESGTVLWMFPQGTMVHPEARPINIYGGAANIARRLDECALVPVAVRYEFLLEQAPDAFACVGPPLLVSAGGHLSSREITTRLQAAMTSTADDLRHDIASSNLRAYRRVLEGRGSVNKAWDRVVSAAGRVKSLVVRG
ncbi:MAG TPA: lysophospholipid acyltransferase family protein [Chloroflexia bacterium]|nr:lysophospholipid acyltransferase family protein [Chloroflexia bacterium]